MRLLKNENENNRVLIVENNKINVVLGTLFIMNDVIVGINLILRWRELHVIIVTPLIL